MNLLWTNSFPVPAELMEINKLLAPIVENNALVSSKPNATLLINSLGQISKLFGNWSYSSN